MWRKQAARDGYPPPGRQQTEAPAPRGGAAQVYKHTLSFLEAKKVSNVTSRDYRRRGFEFMATASQRGWDWRTDEQLDVVLVAYFDEMYFSDDKAQQYNTEP